MVCQHGRRECDGNMMLNCARKHVTDKDKLMEFVKCVMTYLRGTKDGSKVGFSVLFTLIYSFCQNPSSIVILFRHFC